MSFLTSDETDMADAARNSAIYTEEGRHLKARIALKKKLADKKAAEAAGRAATPEEIEAAKKAEELKKAAALLAIETLEKPEEDKSAPREKVKLGKKMVVTTEAKLTADETARIQARCAAGKAGKLKAYVKEEGQVRVITSEDVSNDEVVVFNNCTNGEYNLEAEVIKVFINNCKNCIFRLNGRILTAYVEVDYCEESNIVCNTKIGTFQIEQCKKMNVLFPDKTMFNNYLIWAGCFLLRVQVGEDIMRCDFALYKQFDKTVHVERSQFKVWYDAKGKLVSDKIIRLANGFPTTKKEDDEFNRRQEENMQKMAERMGITIHRDKSKIGNRVKPNAPCPCNSGKKYKKCCRP